MPAAPEKVPAPAKKVQASASAVIVVRLPADATLKVDGTATHLTSNVRVFVSPELKAGQDYQYTLTAQVVRDGKPMQVEQNVVVRAGQESRVSLSLPTTEVAQR
jgi:uncharacterized protein (TIGR03000 family)